MYVNVRSPSLSDVPVMVYRVPSSRNSSPIRAIAARFNLDALSRKNSFVEGNVAAKDDGACGYFIYRRFDLH